MHCHDGFRLIACVGFFLLPQPTRAASTEIELILDASGSMWNKLEDGRFRIDAAKQVLTEFVATTPAREDLLIGLRIYGSKIAYSKPGACEDSELVCPIAPLDRSALLIAIRETRAVGATPLAYSLTSAVNDFHGDGKKQVIICTDGEESCGGDVSAAVAALKTMGSEVDVRFVGIGLPTASAERLGKIAPIENVNSAKRLAEALAAATTTTVPKAATAQLKTLVKVSVKVTKNRQPVTSPDLQIAFQSGFSGAPSVPLQKNGSAWTASVPPGGYSATVMPDNRQFPNLGVSEGRENSFVFDISETPKVTVTPSAFSLVSGTSLDVRFSGAKAVSNSYLVVAHVGSPDAEELTYIEAEGEEGRGAVSIPDEAGDYEIRFTARLAESGPYVVCGHSAPVHAVTPEATVEAPATAFTAAPVHLGWTGPNRARDWVGFIKKGGQTSDYLSYTDATNDTHEADVQAPLLAGEYEVVYANDNTTTILARRSITVIQPEITISAPETAMAGADVKVTWTGPGGSRHFITIVKPDADPSAYNDYASLGEEHTVEIIAPETPGDMELRYGSDATRTVFVRKPIKLTAMTATLDAPATAKAGENFVVKFTGPGSHSDFVRICKAGSADDADPVNYCSAGGGVKQGELSVPDSGNYELRYVANQSGNILARREITVK